MACCALAAFVVSQLFFAIDWLRERIGLTPVAAVASESAAWRLGDAVPAAARSAAFRPRRVLISVASGIAAFAIAYSTLHPGGAHRPHALQIPYLCTSASLPSE